MRRVQIKTTSRVTGRTHDTRRRRGTQLITVGVSTATPVCTTTLILYIIYVYVMVYMAFTL